VNVNRIVVLLSPIFVGVAGWLADWAAKNLPGAPALDKTGLSAVFIAGAVSAGGLVYKWLHGWQKSEQQAHDLQITAQHIESSRQQIEAHREASKPPARKRASG
jgi:hypothetical protein